MIMENLITSYTTYINCNIKSNARFSLKKLKNILICGNDLLKKKKYCKNFNSSHFLKNLNVGFF